MRRQTAAWQLFRALLITSGLLFAAGCTGQPTPAPATEVVSAPIATETMPPATAPLATVPPATAPAATATTAVAATAATTPTQPATTTQADPAATSPAGTALASCPAEAASIQPLASPPFPLDIVYISEGNAWLWSEAGNDPAPLAILDRIRNVRISGDGRWIAMVRQLGAGEELWVIERDGAGEQLLMSPDELQQLVSEPLVDAVLTEQLDWVPGTHTLAFNSSTVISGVMQKLNNDFRLINADSGGRPLWLPAGDGGAFSFSPDGRQTTLWQPGRLSMAGTDGQDGPAPLITYTATIESSEPPQPAWASDSNSLMVAVPGEMGVFSLWKLVTGDPPLQVDEEIGIPGSVAISPNLAVVAYLRPGPDEFEQRELHLAAPDGSWDIVYDAGLSLEFTGWSADGLTFSYQMLPSEGGEAAAFIGKLCAPRMGYEPAPAHGLPRRALRWVDAERFVYVSGEAGAWELRLGNTEGESELLAEMDQPEPVFDLSGDR